MNCRKLIVAAGALAIVGAGLMGAPRPVQAAGGYTQIVHSGPNVADPGTLAAGATITICIQPQSNGTAVGGTVYLSFATAFTPGGHAGGTAAVGATPLTATPASFVASATCTSTNGTPFNKAITVTYTAPSPYPTPKVGRDVLCAADDSAPTAPSCTGPGITNADTYIFSPVSSYVLSTGPPIAPQGTLGPQTNTTFTVTAMDPTMHSAPGVTILLSLTGSAGAPAGSATGFDSVTATVLTIHQMPSRFGADQNGAVSITYTTAALPSAGQTDTIFAEDHQAAKFNISTSYSYARIKPTGVGAPTVAVAPDGTQTIFWQGAGGHLVEVWWNGHWNGPVDWTAANGWPASVSSTPSVALAADGTQIIFWQGTGGHLVEVWWNGHWNGPVDWTAANGWPASVSSAPSVALAPDGTQIIFWAGAGGHLAEVWWNGHWNGPVDWTAANGWGSPLASSPTATIQADGTQLIFWKGAGGHLIEVWWNGHWNGAVDWTAANGWPASVNSAPSLALAPDGTQTLFWQGAGGHLVEVWWNVSHGWNGPVDWTAANGWGSPLTSAPTATIQANGTQLIFWQGAGGHLIEVWWNGQWNGPVDWSA